MLILSFVQLLLKVLNKLEVLMVVLIGLTLKSCLLILYNTVYILELCQIFLIKYIQLCTNHN